MLVSLLLVGAVFCFTGCQNKKDENSIVVGLECGYIPFNYTQTDASNGAVKISNAEGYANGYDIMIAQKLPIRLEKTCNQKLDWDSLLPGVTAGTLDFIIAGMSPTAERLQQIDFSDAYYQSQLVLVVKKMASMQTPRHLQNSKVQILWLKTVLSMIRLWKDKRLTLDTREELRWILSPLW